MATNNNLLEWAVVFYLAAFRWRSSESTVLSAQRLADDRSRGGRSISWRDDPRALEASKQLTKNRNKVYELRTQLPGVLSSAGILPGKINEIVTAFDTANTRRVTRNDDPSLFLLLWFNTYIKPLVNFPKVIRPVDWPY